MYVMYHNIQTQRVIFYDDDDDDDSDKYTHLHFAFDMCVLFPVRLRTALPVSLVDISGRVPEKRIEEEEKRRTPPTRSPSVVSSLHNGLKYIIYTRCTCSTQDSLEHAKP